MPLFRRCHIHDLDVAKEVSYEHFRMDIIRIGRRCRG